jgi:hypothetical protein
MSSADKTNLWLDRPRLYLPTPPKNFPGSARQRIRWVRSLLPLPSGPEPPVRRRSIFFHAFDVPGRSQVSTKTALCAQTNTPGPSYDMKHMKPTRFIPPNYRSPLISLLSCYSRCPHVEGEVCHVLFVACMSWISWAPLPELHMMVHEGPTQLPTISDFLASRTLITQAHKPLYDVRPLPLFSMSWPPVIKGNKRAKQQK